MRLIDADMFDAVAEYAKTRNDAETAVEPMRWIPCSKRLPDADSRVLVQYSNGDMSVIDCCRPKYWNMSKPPIVAWMPTPEPWESVE